MKNEATMILMCKWVKNDEAIQGFKFKRVKNEAKMVVIFKRARIEVRSGFKIQPSQEWSYKWFSWSNESRLKFKWSMVHIYKRVKNEPRRGFKVETSKE